MIRRSIYDDEGKKYLINDQTKFYKGVSDAIFASHWDRYV